MRDLDRVAYAALAAALLAGCGEDPIYVDSGAIAQQRRAVVTTAAQKRDRPVADDATIHQWPALTTLRDDAADGIMSDGRGPYTQSGHEFSVAYDYSLTSSREDRIFIGLYGKGGDPRYLRLRIPGVVEMDCGWAQYLVSYDDLYEQPSGSTVYDGHLVVRCAEDSRAPRYEVTFDPCVRIANPSPDRYVASTDASCPARVDLDGQTLAYATAAHQMEADLER